MVHLVFWWASKSTLPIRSYAFHQYPIHLPFCHCTHYPKFCIVFIQCRMLFVWLAVSQPHIKPQIMDPRYIALIWGKPHVGSMCGAGNVGECNNTPPRSTKYFSWNALVHVRDPMNSRLTLWPYWIPRHGIECNSTPWLLVLSHKSPIQKV